MRLALLAFAVLTVPASAAPQKCAHITGGVVDNVIVADPALALPGVDCSNANAQVGWTFNGTTYTVVTPPIVYQTTGLTFQQFVNLFTVAEYNAVMLAEPTDAAIGTFITKYAGAQFNLSDPAIVSAINYLVSKSLISAARAAIILAGRIP